MYRVYGMPLTIPTRQASVYLRCKRVPHTLHVTSIYTTRMAVWWYGAKANFCNLAPTGETLLSFTDLVQHVEDKTPYPLMLPPASTNAQLRTATWLLHVYASWWLMNIGGLYRWFYDENIDIVQQYASYFMLVSPTTTVLAKGLRERMRTSLSEHGITYQSVDYMLDHFSRLVDALEAHLESHRFLLGEYVTLADATLVATFDCHFLRDSPPKEDLLENSPNVVKWVEEITNSDPKSLDAVTSQEISMPDEIPDSLLTVLSICEEVMPWLQKQVDSVHSLWMAKGKQDLTLQRVEGGDATWTMTVDGVDTPCSVCMAHVKMAQSVAHDVAALDLPDSARARMLRQLELTDVDIIATSKAGVEDTYIVKGRSPS